MWKAVNRRSEVNDTTPVATFRQLPTPRPLVPVDDPPTHGTSWNHVFTKYDKNEAIFGGLWRILGPGRARLANNQTFFCITHSHALQRALAATGHTPKEMLNTDTCFLDSPALREALSPDIKLSNAQVERIGSIHDLENLPYTETPQYVIKKQNLWQLKCEGNLAPTSFGFNTITIFQGFERYTDNLGRHYDAFDECAKDTNGLRALTNFYGG
jgi:hypothetical protein